MVDATTMHKQVLVLRLISKYRTLGMLAADLDPLHQHAPDYIADLDLATYGFTEADMDTEFDVGSYKAGPQRMRLRDIVASLQGDVHAHARRRVHVHHRHGDQALLPGAAGADPLAPDLSRRSSASTSSSGSPRRRPSSATCTRSTSGRSASRAKAATR